MKNKIKAALVALGILAATLGGASSAHAAVPYTWMCYKAGHSDVWVKTPSSVGYWTVYRGYRCVGGFYSWV